MSRGVEGERKSGKKRSKAYYGATHSKKRVRHVCILAFKLPSDSERELNSSQVGPVRKVSCWNVDEAHWLHCKRLSWILLVYFLSWPSTCIQNVALSSVMWEVTQRCSLSHTEKSDARSSKSSLRVTCEMSISLFMDSWILCFLLVSWASPLSPFSGGIVMFVYSIT